MEERMAKSISSALVVIVLLSALPLSLYGTEKDTLSPKVIDTDPKNGSRDVDPALKEISVTFSEPMMDKSWSWSYEEKNSFPQMTGQPFYSKNFTKCILPVSLERNKEYVIWINTSRLQNFRNKAGVPVPPYKLTFTTR
jgi:hypothetical protein